MKQLLIGGMITLLVTLLAQAAASGGRRRRSLTAAGRELDVALKLDETQPQKQQLIERAIGRLDRYLLEPPIERRLRWTLRAVVLVASFGIATAVNLFTGNETLDSWVYLLIGAVIGGLWSATEERVNLLVSRRLGFA